jgi:hypothetical protein
MWKRLGQPLSGKQMTIAVMLVLAIAGAFYGAYRGAANFWHLRTLEKVIPAALDGLRNQRDALSGTIEEYKRQLGYYPPLLTGPGNSRGVINPLCYEMLGTRFDSNRGDFHISVSKDTLSIDEVQKYFNMRSFSNSLPFPTWPTNFLAGRPLAIAPFSKECDAFGLGISFTDIVPERFWEDFEFTVWRYATNPAEHNPGKFDLWVEVNVAGKHFTIGNWPEVK